MPQIPGFVGDAYNLRSPNVSASRMINLFAEVVQGDQGKVAAYLQGTPGTVERYSLAGAGGMRALFTTGHGRVFGVRGPTLYELFPGGTSLARGTLHTASGPVSLAENGLQLVLVDGSATGYHLTLADNTFATIADPDFQGADRVAFLDQYLLFNKPGTQQFYWSDLASVDFDALDIASAEGSPDALLSLHVHHRELRLFGRTSTEVWFDVGPPAVFARIQGAFYECGIIAPQSVAADEYAVYWLGQDKRGTGMVYRAQSYQPEPISTHAVTQALQSYSDLTDALGWCQQQDGHTFYWLTCPTGNATWCFDATTGLWHERSYRDPTTGALGRHRANCYTFGHGMHLIGDYATGQVSELRMDAYSDNGDALVSLRRFPHVADGESRRRVRQSRLQVDLETGVGLDGSPPVGIDPQLMLKWSNDGHTWSNEHWVSAGKIGEYGRRAVWHRLGAPRDRVYEVSISDPVKRVFLSAHLTGDVLTS